MCRIAVEPLTAHVTPNWEDVQPLVWSSQIEGTRRSGRQLSECRIRLAHLMQFPTD
jgi:hypothetical protein